MRRQVAVALKYDLRRDAAPSVAAKGRGAVAERILQIARDNDIPLHHDANLAEVLAALELDQLIPEHLYPVISEILAYIYRMNEDAQHDMRAG